MPKYTKQLPCRNGNYERRWPNVKDDFTDQFTRKICTKTERLMTRKYHTTI